MNIAPTVQKTLAAQQADHEFIAHSHTESSNGTARASFGEPDASGGGAWMQ